VIEQILQGDRYLQVDQVEQARAIYQGVVDLDPNNAIATVGLAQCALADGHDRQAHELAARALELDPENDMARRMEARLAEVLTVRGEHIERPDAAGAPAAEDMRPMITTAADEVAEPPTPADTSATAKAPAPAEPSAPATAKTPAPAANKSFFDRLMGR
jgi:tetratricopeptide (TPR) repeat protein